MPIERNFYGFKDKRNFRDKYDEKTKTFIPYEFKDADEERKKALGYTMVGYLNKLSPTFPYQWQKRLFELSHDRTKLTYYNLKWDLAKGWYLPKNQEEAPRGVINLSDPALKVQRNKNLINITVSMGDSKQRDYILKAEDAGKYFTAVNGKDMAFDNNEDLAVAWVKAITDPRLVKEIIESAYPVKEFFRDHSWVLTNKTIPEGASYYYNTKNKEFSLPEDPQPNWAKDAIPILCCAHDFP